MYLYQFTLELIEDASYKIFYFDLQLRRKFSGKKRIYKTKVNSSYKFSNQKFQKKLSLFAFLYRNLF